MPPEVARAFDALPGDVRPALVRLRALIFATAEAEGAGPVEEAALAILIARALTWHVKGKRRR